MIFSNCSCLTCNEKVGKVEYQLSLGQTDLMLHLTFVRELLGEMCDHFYHLDR